MTQPIFFDGVDDLVRTLIRAPLMYAVIVLFIRASGKRSLSQMNSFDWIVTVALGSIVASGVLLKDVTLAETGLAIGVFLALQYALTSLSSRSEAVSHFVKATPILLIRDGVYLEDAMRSERIAKDELLAAVRQHGLASVEEVGWAILETNAKISVIPARGSGPGSSALPPSALTNVSGAL